MNCTKYVLRTVEIESISRNGIETSFLTIPRNQLDRFNSIPASLHFIHPIQDLGNLKQMRKRRVSSSSFRKHHPINQQTSSNQPMENFSSLSAKTKRNQFSKNGFLTGWLVCTGTIPMLAILPTILLLIKKRKVELHVLLYIYYIIFFIVFLDPHTIPVHACMRVHVVIFVSYYMCVISH